MGGDKGPHGRLELTQCHRFLRCAPLSGCVPRCCRSVRAVVSDTRCPDNGQGIVEKFVDNAGEMGRTRYYPLEECPYCLRDNVAVHIHEKTVMGCAAGHMNFHDRSSRKRDNASTASNPKFTALQCKL
jgi:hypothetical protein